MAQNKVCTGLQRPSSADPAANLVTVPGQEMRTEELVEQVIKPATEKTRRRFAELEEAADSVWSPDRGHPPFAFVSHAFKNPFRLVIDALLLKYKGADLDTTFVWIDIFASAVLSLKSHVLLPASNTLQTDQSGSISPCLAQSTSGIRPVTLVAMVRASETR